MIPLPIKVLFITFVCLLIQSCKPKKLHSVEYYPILLAQTDMMFNPCFIGEDTFITLDSLKLKVLATNSIKHTSVQIISSTKTILSVGKHNNFIFACNDSIYFRYNQDDKTIKTYRYSKTFNFNGEDFYALDFADNSNIQLIDSENVLTRIYPLHTSPYSLHFYYSPVLAILNLNSGHYTVLNFSYPEIFTSSRFGSLNRIFFGVFDNKIFASDQVSGQVQYCDLKNLIIANIDLNDSRIQTSEIDSTSNLDFNIIFDHLENTSYIHDFFYNEYNQRFYRIIKTEKVKNRETKGNENKFAIIQEFNKNFELTAEMNLSEEFNIYRVSKFNSGVLVSYPSRNKELRGFIYNLISSND